MNMNIKKIILTAVCALALFGAGAYAATFNVAAPTGNPTTDTGNIQAAINSATASADPTNLVVLQPGATPYVLDAELAIAGDAVNVTVTSSGAPVILVGANIAGPMFNADVTNSNVGWQNLVLLPPPFTTMGAASNGSQSAINVNTNSATSTFTLNSLVITINNNANQPASTDGSVDPSTLTNYTYWGGGGMLMAGGTTPSNPGGNHNNVYLKDVVSSGNAFNFYSGGYNTPTTPPTINDQVVLEDCTFSWSTADGISVGGTGTVRLINVEAHHNGPAATPGDRAFDIWRPQLLYASGCYVHDNLNYGIVTNFAEQIHLENCVTANNAKYGIGERNGASVEYATATIVNCTSINDLYANTSTSTNFICVARLPFTWITVENFTVFGSATSTQGLGATYGIGLFSPRSASVRNCYVSNCNRAGIILFDGRAPGTDVTIEDCVVEDCGTDVNGGLTPIHDDTNYGGASYYLFSPIALNDGSNVVVRNTTVRRTEAPAVSVNFVGGDDNGVALLEDVTLEDCAEKLADIRTEPLGANVITIRNWLAMGDSGADQVQGYGTGIQVMGADVTVEDCTIANRIEEAIFNKSAGAGTETNVHTYSNVDVRDVGGPAISVLNANRGSTVISNCSIRNVTGGEGVLFSGGQHSELSSVEVINAASWGISVGNPDLGAPELVSMDVMDDLCLVGNGSGGLRFVQTGAAGAEVALTNSTIIDNPVGISYESLIGQVLDVTDCIIAGPTGIGIEIPTQVGFTGAGAPPPRVRVWTTALVNEGPWALTTQTSVAGSNEAGTLDLVTGIESTDPWFKSTNPDAADFLVVQAVAYEGIASNVGAGQTADLDGCSRYEKDGAGVEAWRLR